MDKRYIYDDAKWHYESEDYPKNLPIGNAFTHTGFYVAWIINNDLYNKETITNCANLASIQLVKERKMTGKEFYQTELCGVFTNEELNQEGNAFTLFFYDRYADIIDKISAKNLSSIYATADSWDNYETIKKILDLKYALWKSEIGKRTSVNNIQKQSELKVKYDPTSTKENIKGTIIKDGKEYSITLECTNIIDGVLGDLVWNENIENFEDVEGPGWMSEIQMEEGVGTRVIIRVDDDEDLVSELPIFVKFVRLFIDKLPDIKKTCAKDYPTDMKEILSQNLQILYIDLALMENGVVDAHVALNENKTNYTCGHILDINELTEERILDGNFEMMWEG